MSDCSRSAVFLLSGSVLLSWQHYGMLSVLHSFRRPKAISSAGTVRCFRCYIVFVGPKLSSVFWFGPRSKISFRCGWWCWWAVCHCLWWVLIDGFQHSSILLHDQQMFHSSDCITLVWCPSVVFERLILWGGFLSPTHARSVRDWCKRGCKSWNLELAIPESMIVHVCWCCL